MSGHQTATIEDTVYFWFAANDTSGSGADGATPLFDVREAGAAAGAIPLVSGTPTLLSHANYPAGCHEIAVAATVANGFAADDTFAVFCTLLVDSQNPSGFVGSCTLTPLAKQSQLDNLANVGSATNTSATTYALTTGTQSSGTFASTAALDGTNHEHIDTAGAMDLYYEFNIGGGTPSSVRFTGYLNGNNDDLEVYGYDWVATGWVQIGTLSGKASSVNEVKDYDLFTNMVGTGANRGLVRVRFTDGAFTLTTATLAVDQIFVSYSSASAGYDGFIWFDSNASNTNTVSNVDGTSGNPVSTEAAVVTLSANLNINRIKVAPGATYTLASTYNNYFFDGDGIWALVLGGQDVGGTTFKGANVSGIGTGSTEILFIAGEIGTATIHPFHMHAVALTGTLTLGAVGNYAIGNSHSGIAGSTTPIIDMGASIGNVNLTMPGYDQGVEIRNLNSTGVDLFSISGQGQIIYAASSSGAANRRGEWKVTNNGTVTETVDDNTANLDSITGAAGALLDSTATSAQLVDDMLDEALSGHNVAGSVGKALRQIKEGVVAEEATINDASATTTDFITTLTSAVDNFYIDVSLIFIDGVLKGQSKPISSYDGSTKTVTLDEALTSAPGDGDAFIIKTDHVHPISQIVTGILTTQMTEDYAADGVAPNLAQAIFEILQQSGEFSISGTTITVKKLDGSTAAMTFTLDDATNPTSRTRAT